MFRVNFMKFDSTYGKELEWWNTVVTIFEKKSKKNCSGLPWKIEKSQIWKKFQLRFFCICFLMFVITAGTEYSEPCQVSKMKLFTKFVYGFQLLTMLAKSYILDVWKDSEYVSELFCSTVGKSCVCKANVHENIGKSCVCKANVHENMEKNGILNIWQTLIV